MTQAMQNGDDLDFLRDQLRLCLRLDIPDTELGRAETRRFMTIWTLQTCHIQNILARYAPSKTRRANAARHLSQHTAKGFRTRLARERARIIALTLILNPWAAQSLHEAFDMTRDEWRASRHRRLTCDIRSWLDEIDVDSLRAWKSAVDSLRNNT